MSYSNLVDELQGLMLMPALRVGLTGHYSNLLDEIGDLGLENPVNCWRKNAASLFRQAGIIDGLLGKEHETGGVHVSPAIACDASCNAIVPALGR